jgi:hypothetical protein
MRIPSRHPRLATAACKVYRLAIWLSPPEFRRAYGRELAVTFRTRVEDVLEADSLRDCLGFAAHIAVDTLRTWSFQLTPGEAPREVSLLGLSDDEVAHGTLDLPRLDIQVVFVSAGVGLAFTGWFAYLFILPAYVY